MTPSVAAGAAITTQRTAKAGSGHHKRVTPPKQPRAPYLTCLP
jgi:hypothetical protein